MYLQYLVDILNEGNLYTFTIETNDKPKTTLYLQSISKDVKFVKELEKFPKKAKGNRCILEDGTRIIDCHFRKDKISTFRAAKDVYSDDRCSLVENEECSYEILEESKWNPIRLFQSIQSGDVIREISKSGIPGLPKVVLCNPNLVNDEFRVTVNDVKEVIH
jgi:hypothetical protein